MPTSSQDDRVVRVFISSTFRDMHAERDYLSRIVFPELRSRCVRRGAEFIGLDLRWGITEEEAQKDGALAICLDEIERCRPFFICLLGERFGWIPPPEEVPTELFDRVAASCELPTAIARCYRLDTTVTPPRYRLRREQPVGADVAETLAHFWSSKGLPLAGESITAREILRGVFDEGYPPSHALFYLRRPGLPDDPAFPPDLASDFLEKDEYRRRKLDDLKSLIRSRADRFVVREYDVRYAGLRLDPSLLPSALDAGDQAALADGVISREESITLSAPLRQVVTAHGTVALEGLENLGRQLLDDLWIAIERELDRPVGRRDEYDEQRAYHERFVVDRTRLFIGRATERERVLTYIRSKGDTQPLVVTGQPGCGKSAFIAECVRVCRENYPGMVVIPHFIGAAPGSAALSTTLRSVCETLNRELELDEEVSADPQELRRQLAAFLEKADPERPLVLFIDALNQLDPSERSHELDWLPVHLPAATKLVVSTIAGDCLDRLHAHVTADHVVRLPLLPADDCRALVERFLAARRKRFTDEQLERMLDTSTCPDAALPLYLLVALEELCLFGDHQALSARIERLPARLPDLFAQVLARLEHDHTRSVTESVCASIAVSRSGLLESELLDLLGNGGTFPRARWTRLYRALEPYLKPLEEESEHGAGRLDFYHEQLRSAAYQRYLKMADAAAEPREAYRLAHRHLAAYFRSLALDEALPRRWRADRGRALSELPYHQAHGRLLHDLEDTLCDLRFVEAKCSARMTYALVADYDLAQAATSAERPNQTRLAEFARFVRGQADVLTRYPALCFQQAHNQPDATSVAAAATRLWDAEGEPRPWFRRVNKPRDLDRCVMTLRGPRADVTYAWTPACAWAPDGRRLVSTCADNTLKIWNVDTGEERLTLAGHSAELTACAWAPGGDKVVSAARDRTLKVWDVATGEVLMTLVGHDDDVVSCAWAPNGRYIASGSVDDTLRIWEANTGALLVALEAHSSTVMACAWSADGRRLASASADGTLRIWGGDLWLPIAVFRHSPRTSPKRTPGTPVNRRLTDPGTLALEGFFDAAGAADEAKTVLSCAWAPDGRRIVAAFKDKTLRIFDVDKGEETASLLGHVQQIEACEWSGDGRWIASVSMEGRLKIWDADTCGLRVELFGHTGFVHDCAWSADSQWIASASEDFTIRVWDARRLDQAISPDAPGVTTVDCSWAPDGRRIAVVCGDDTLKIRDVETGHTLASVDHPDEGDGPFAWDPDGRLMLSSDRDTLIVWDLETEKELANVEKNWDKWAHWSPDGNRIVSPHYDGPRVWHPHTGAQLLTLGDSSRHCAWSPDGRVIASRSSRRVEGVDKSWVCAWDAETGEELCRSNRMKRGDWSRDGRVLLALAANAMNVWHPDTGDEFSIPSGPCKKRERFVWSPDGRAIVAAHSDHSMSINIPATGEAGPSMFDNSGMVVSCGWTPDAKHVVAACADRTVRLWDAQDGELIQMYFGRGLKVSPSGHLFIALAITIAEDISILHLEGHQLGPPVVTAIYLYRFDRHQHEREPSTQCPWCGRRFTPSRAVLDAIGGIARDADVSAGDSPCLKLPSVAWDESRLVSECSHCGQPVRFNPFVVDNRHRWPSATVVKHTFRQ